MTAFITQLLDGKLRGARRLGRRHVKDARRLLGRSKNELNDKIRSDVTEGIAELDAALSGTDEATIKRAAEKLRQLSEKHLETFRKPAWRESIESVVVAVCVALMLRAFVVEAFKIPSGSMIPTLAIGDQIFVNKFVYGIRVPFTSIRLIDFSMPDHGDVVVFICPVEPHEDYIKRVIGRPGDEIAVRNGTVYVNGVARERESLGRAQYWDRSTTTERWHPFEAQGFREQSDGHTYTVLEDQLTPATDYGPFVVPEGHVFVMGDNRDHSYDSRMWGPVPLNNILGRAMFVWWSWGQKKPDWARLFTGID